MSSRAALSIFSLHATQCWNTRYPCNGNVCVAVSHAHMILPCLHGLGSKVHAVQASTSAFVYISRIYSPLQCQAWLSCARTCDPSPFI